MYIKSRKGAVLRLPFAFGAGRHEIPSLRFGRKMLQQCRKKSLSCILQRFCVTPYLYEKQIRSRIATPSLFLVRARGHEILASPFALRGARCTNRVKTRSLLASCRGSASPLIRTKTKTEHTRCSALVLVRARGLDSRRDDAKPR